MPTSPTPSAFKPSNSQDRNTIKIPDSQISNNDILHSDNEDQGLDSLETHSLSTTAPNLPNAVGLQRFPSPNVDPTRPTTPSNPQSISITTPYEEEPTEPPATASTNASTTATASNTTSLQLQAIDPPTTNSSNRTQASTIHPAPPPSADDNPPNDAATTALPPYDWHLLSTRYEAALAPLREQEDALTAEFEAWTKLFHNWTLSGRRKEESRGAKRLRTQIQYVRMREEGFEAGRRHYEKCKEQAERLLESLREDV